MGSSGYSHLGTLVRMGYSQWVHLGTPGIHVGLTIVMSEKTQFTKTKTAVLKKFRRTSLPPGPGPE